MLASLSLGFAFVLTPAPATTRLTAHDRMPPPVAMLTRQAQRRLPRICSTPEAVRAATPPYAAARTLHTPHWALLLTAAPSPRRVGSEYRSVVELPVIGEQHFGLSVTSDREAQLRLKGALDLDEPVYYNVGSDGKQGLRRREVRTPLTA